MSTLTPGCSIRRFAFLLIPGWLWVEPLGGREALCPEAASFSSPPVPSPRPAAATALQHWAFQPFKKVSPPSDSDGSAIHPNDRFIAKQLREKHLQPVPAADRRTLARRIYFDLIGLPPAPEELEEYQRRLKEMREEIQRLENAKKKETEEKLQKLRGELRNLEKSGLPLDLPGAYAVAEGPPVEANIQLKGEPGNPGPTVKRNAPAFLSAERALQIPEGASGRRELAEWLARPDHPLTARVMVNRLWQHHFGKGLVATPSNFGQRGEKPTHPELLDWLAAQFVESGWSIKSMHRLIMTSQSYQRSSSGSPENAERDPGNRSCWRFDRRRLEAESIRDALLGASGELNLERPGPHPFPPVEAWHWTQHNPFKEVYPSKHRSVYLMTQRFQRHPYLALFDGPDANTSTDLRHVSNVPLQALYLMNHPFIDEAARKFAARLLRKRGDARARLKRACLLAWSRQPTPAETEKYLAHLQRLREEAARSSPGRCSRPTSSCLWIEKPP